MPPQTVPKALYLDTSAVLKFLEGHPGVHQQAFSLISQAVNDGRWVCYLSEFALMEMVDQTQSHTYIKRELRTGALLRAILNKEHSEIYLDRRQLTTAYNHVWRWYESHSDILTLALPALRDLSVSDTLLLAWVIAGNSVMRAPDSLHLAIALLLGCDMLVTSDEQFRDEVNKSLPRLGTKLNTETIRVLARITGVPPSVLRAQASPSGRLIYAYRMKELVARFQPRRPSPPAA